MSEVDPTNGRTMAVVVVALLAIVVVIGGVDPCAAGTVPREIGPRSGVWVDPAPAQ